jgi:hypothetical protein
MFAMMMRAPLAGALGEPVYFPENQHQSGHDNDREDVAEPVQVILPAPMADFPAEQQDGRQQVEDDAKAVKKFPDAVHDRINVEYADLPSI